MEIPVNCSFGWSITCDKLPKCVDCINFQLKRHLDYHEVVRIMNTGSRAWQLKLPRFFDKNCGENCCPYIRLLKNCCSGEKEVVLLIDNNCILAESVVEWNDLNDYENSTSHARRFWSQSCNLYLVCFKLEDNSKGRVPYCLIWIWTCDRVNFSSQFYTTRPQLSGITKKQH